MSIPSSFRCSWPVVLALVLATGCDYMAYDVLRERGDAPPSECEEGRAECDGNAITVCETNIRTNPANCGVCGRDCKGGACRDGLCEAVPLVSSFESSPSGLYKPPFTRKEHVYWATGGGTKIRMHDTLSGLTTTVASLDPPVSVTGRTVRTTIAWNWIYWVNPDEGVLRRAGLAGGEVSVEVGADVIDVAATGDVVWWMLSDGSVWSQRATQAGSRSQRASGLTGVLRLVGSPYGRVFVLTQSGVVDIGSVPKAPLELPGVVSASAVPASEDEEYDAVVWGTSAGELFRLPYAQWDAPLGGLKPIVQGMEAPRSVLVPTDAETGAPLDAMYWITGSDDSGHIYGMDPRLRGGEPMKMAEITATELVGDESTLYWIDRNLNTVLRMTR